VCVCELEDVWLASYPASAHEMSGYEVTSREFNCMFSREREIMVCNSLF